MNLRGILYVGVIALGGLVLIGSLLPQPSPSAASSAPVSSLPASTGPATDDEAQLKALVSSVVASAHPADDEPSEAQMDAVARRYEVAHQRDGAPQLGSCTLLKGSEHDACVVARYTFAKNDWRLARAGDISAARNVAWCLSTGCGGGVAPQPIRGCAWRLFIFAYGSPDQDSSDGENMKQECGALAQTDQLMAKSQSLQLFDQIPALRDRGYDD